MFAKFSLKADLQWRRRFTCNTCTMSFMCCSESRSIFADLHTAFNAHHMQWCHSRVWSSNKHSAILHKIIHHKQTWKSTQRRHKHCTLAVCSKAEPKNFALPLTPFPGARDGQNLISWRWSLPLPTNPVWWGSMHAISSYRVIGPTSTHTHPPTHRQHCLQYTVPQLVLNVNSTQETDYSKQETV